MSRMYTKRFDVSQTTSVALRPRAGHSRTSFSSTSSAKSPLASFANLSSKTLTRKARVEVD